MKTNNKYTFMRATAFVVMSVYLFIVVAHLFFTPAFQYKAISGNAISVKPNIQLIYTLVRTNRCTVNNDKIAEVLTKQHPAFFTLLLFGPGEFIAANNSCTVFSQPAANKQFSYLQNRVLRI